LLIVGCTIGSCRSCWRGSRGCGLSTNPCCRTLPLPGSCHCATVPLTPCCCCLVRVLPRISGTS
jgi:hypothetical protein